MGAFAYVVPFLCNAFPCIVNQVNPHLSSKTQLIPFQGVFLDVPNSYRARPL